MTAPGPVDRTDPATDAVAEPSASQTQTRHAAGIYGLVVTAAVLASAGGTLRTGPLTLAVVSTLVVYWLAEQYAESVAHTHAGHLPSLPHVRSALAAKWPMVSASAIPLAALLLARILGASTVNAAYVALVVTVAMLTTYGWMAGRAAGMRGARLWFMASAAGVLGLLMIVLKIVISHLH